MDERRDQLNETDSVKKTTAKGFDAWEDLRAQETKPFDTQPDNESGVIDIPQTGSLFEVLSETAAKEKAAMAELQAERRNQAASGSDTIPLPTLGGSPEPDAGTPDEAEAEPPFEVEPQDEDEEEVVYEVRFDPPSSSRLSPPFGIEPEPQPDEPEPLPIETERSPDEPEPPPAVPEMENEDIEERLDELDEGIREEMIDKLYAEALADMSAGTFTEATGEAVSEAPEEEYSHPFFDLPPLERSVKKHKKGKDSRAAGLDAQTDPNSGEDAERSKGIELWKILLAILIFMLFAIGSYFVGQVYGASLIPDEPSLIIPPEEDVFPEVVAEGDKGPQILTLLLMGTDEREKGEQARADTIILVAINLDTRDVDMISIPRDTRTQIADSDTTTKINHAHTFGGPELLVKTAENLLGVNIHYYVETNFKGFANCVDILGGVDYNVERRMLFIEEGIDLYPGQQKLNGDKALQYVRWRGDPSADIGRVGRQQKFIKAFLDQAISLGTLAKLPSLMGELRENVKTDMTTPRMLNLAFRFIDIKNLNFTSATLPGEAKTIGGGAYWVMDEEAAKEMIMSIYAPPEPEPEPETEQEPEAESEPEPASEPEEAA